MKARDCLKPRVNQRPIVVVMGVSGCGKSTVGSTLAKRLGLPFVEGDEYHPKENIARMSQGRALDDKDRWPWLDALCFALNQSVEESGGVVASCSALKRSYRDFIRDHVHDPVLFAFLEGDGEIIFKRLQARSGHFMPPTLLDVQMKELERPEADEPVIVFSANKKVDALVAEIAEVIA